MSISKVIALLVSSLMLIASLAAAQPPGDLGNRFARATITQNDKPLLMGTIFKDTEDNLIVKGAPVVNVIARAYGVEAYRVVDAPEWVYQAHLYDIEAVPPPAELVESDETQMLLSLLDDRFQLQVRHETRDVEMLVLDIADPEKQRQLALATPRYDRANLPTTLEPGTPIAAATTFIRYREEPILDLTGGSVYLQFNPFVSATGVLHRPLASLIENLRESGVALEYRTVSLDVLVVTRIERPRLDVVDH